MSVGVIAGLSLALLTRAGAQAVAVPDATIEYTVGVQAPVDAPLTNATFSGFSCGVASCETDSVSVTTSLVLQSSGNAGGFWSADPAIFATVYYELVGPANTQAQVLISGNGAVSLNNEGGYAYSAIDAGISSPSAICTELDAEVCGVFGNPTGTAGPVTQTLTVKSDTVYKFVLESACEAVAGTCSSILDPTIKVTSGNALEFNVELSPNVAAVPEPGTLPLMAVGLGGLAWIMRRRRIEMMA